MVALLQGQTIQRPTNQSRDNSVPSNQGRDAPRAVGSQSRDQLISANGDHLISPASAPQRRERPSDHPPARGQREDTSHTAMATREAGGGTCPQLYSITKEYYKHLERKENVTKAYNNLSCWIEGVAYHAHTVKLDYKSMIFLTIESVLYFNLEQ
jgi:hypothetical protein